MWFFLMLIPSLLLVSLGCKLCIVLFMREGCTEQSFVGLLKSPRWVGKYLLGQSCGCPLFQVSLPSVSIQSLTSS